MHDFCFYGFYGLFLKTFQNKELSRIDGNLGLKLIYE